MGNSISRLLTPGAVLDPRSESALFSSLRMENGIFKTTVAGRLREMDQAMIAAWPPGAPMREILDVGVSSGTTSLEWLQALQKAGFVPQLTATDLSLKGRLLAPWPGYKVLLDGGGRPLQHLLLRMPVRPWRRRLDYVTQNWLIVGLANAVFLVAKRSGAIARGQDKGVDVLLVAPQAAANASISFEEDDLLAANPPAYVGRFDAIRAANLLLPGSFGPDLLRRGVANLKERLVGPGALLVVARTLSEAAGEVNHGTVFMLGGDRRFQVSRRVGNGSELEELVLSV